MKNTIKEKIIEIIKELGIEEVDFVIETPGDIVNGDYSTNIALVLSKILNKKPIEIADEIVSKLKDLKEFSKIEKAGPGFINFYLSDETIREKVLNPKFVNDSLKGQEILVEFTDPNPFKQFHIGHLMSNTIGESLSRIFEANGADVKRICYPGDIGLHVAKSIWAIKKHVAFFPADQDSLEDKTKFLGDSYVFGTKEYKENPEAKQEIDELNKNLFDNKDVDIQTQTFYIKGRKWSLEYFDKLYEILGTKFDKFYFETESAPIGMEIVKSNLGKVFEESEGAIIYRGEQDGLHTRVFVNSRGVPTYETKDLGLFYLKERDYKPNRSIIITGNEQADYFKVMFAVIKKIDIKIKEKTTHLHHGMLRFSDRKMSSRTGDVITADDLINQIKNLVEEKIKDREVAEKDKEEIKEKVAIGAFKYSVLKQGIGKDIIYDFDKSISFEGDSGPYLQYAYTRAKSVLEKTPRLRSGQTSSDVWKLTNLERMLIQYLDVLENALNDLAPQHLVGYLTRLAGEFNSFYANNKILDETDPNSPYKIAITKAVKETLENGLQVLGIGIPSRM